MKGVDARIANTLLRKGITPLASSEGNSDTTVSFVVRESDTLPALSAIHSLFF